MITSVGRSLPAGARGHVHPSLGAWAGRHWSRCGRRCPSCRDAGRRAASMRPCGGWIVIDARSACGRVVIHGLHAPAPRLERNPCAPPEDVAHARWARRWVFAGPVERGFLWVQAASTSGKPLTRAMFSSATRRDSEGGKFLECLNRIPILLIMYGMVLTL